MHETRLPYSRSLLWHFVYVPVEWTHTKSEHKTEQHKRNVYMGNGVKCWLIWSIPNVVKFIPFNLLFRKSFSVKNDERLFFYSFRLTTIEYKWHRIEPQRNLIWRKCFVSIFRWEIGVPRKLGSLSLVPVWTITFAQNSLLFVFGNGRNHTPLHSHKVPVRFLTRSFCSKREFIILQEQ